MQIQVRTLNRDRFPLLVAQPFLPFIYSRRWPINARLSQSEGFSGKNDRLEISIH